MMTTFDTYNRLLYRYNNCTYIIEQYLPIFRFLYIFLFTDRSDFVGGIDNEALDFSHLTDEFIQNNNTEANQ